MSFSSRRSRELAAAAADVENGRVPGEEREVGPLCLGDPLLGAAEHGLELAYGHSAAPSPVR